MYDLYRILLEKPGSLDHQVDAGPERHWIGMSELEKRAGVRFVRLEDATAIGREAAMVVAGQLARKPDSSIVFPTGKTPLPMYRALRDLSGGAWSSARLFQLDEYIPPSDAESPLPYQTFAAFMREELWGQIAGQAYYMESFFDRPTEYEALVTQDGGPDMVILGIGGNGHVAFNEPGSPVDARTRVVDLAEETMLSNFGAVRKLGFPVQAMTLGLHTILSARTILLLATGLRKQSIVRQAFSPDTEPTGDCPASWLKRHPNVIVMTDFEVFPCVD